MVKSKEESTEIHRYVPGIRTKSNETYAPGIIPESTTVCMEYVDYPFIWIKM